MTKIVEEVAIQSASIQLDQFLKWAGIAQTGGHAKLMISEGFITVNGEEEKRRSRKLLPGDKIQIRDIGVYKIVKE